ncbi:hypothetical protein LguiA_010666 [Lonicera macranthoides]
MATCLSSSYSPDYPRTRRNPFPIYKSPRFTSEETLFLLQKCHNFKQLKQIHAKIIKTGLSQDQSVVTKLLKLCSSYKKMDYATLIFEKITNPTTFTWNLMIRFYTISDNSIQALMIYNLMICKGVNPDKFTFPFAVKACASLSLIEKGKEVQMLALKSGFGGDIYLQNVLMDFYFKCGDSDYGRKVFDRMPVRTVVSWTTLISGLVSSGELDDALLVFDQMPVRNVVAWTAIIDGFARSERPQEAFELFRRMQADNVRPNEFTLVSLLIACTQLGSLKLGSWIHNFALENGFKIGSFLGTALIDMYSKCASLEYARQVFYNMEDKSLATWNSMITSLGVHGCGEEALYLFAKMEKENVKPDAITFVGVLCACVHINDVDMGRRYFEYMSDRYGISPIAEHLDCISELSKRANMLDEFAIQ